MGFAIYRGGDWDAREFDTGWGKAAENIALSLANAGRTVLESRQLDKENKLKNEQMDLARKKEANDTNARMIDRQTAKEEREQNQTNYEREVALKTAWRGEDIERNKALEQAQLKHMEAQTKATQANTAATYYEMKKADTLEKKTQILGNLFTAAQTAGSKMVGTILAYTPQAEMDANGQYTGKVTGGPFRDNEINRQWEYMVRYNKIDAAQLPTLLQQFENKYKGVDQLFTPEFQSAFNQTADDYNVKNNVYHAASNWDGKTKLDPSIEAPNAIGTFYKRQLTDEAIDTNLKKINDSDPKWKAFEAMYPEEAKNVKVKAAFSDLINKTINPILYEKSLYAKIRAMASQLFAGEKKTVPSGGKPLSKNSEYLQSLLSSNPFYKYNK